MGYEVAEVEDIKLGNILKYRSFSIAWRRRWRMR
jgi:hypothetical protein